jgi:N-acetylglucosaminyldiphosphoundecaprenol N-acetyl-beta-D-mannosaminyltransferase
MNDVVQRNIELAGMSIDVLDYDAVLDELFSSLAVGQGGWIVTANLDILRRSSADPEIQALYASADVRVADGMPLVWAARLQGDHLPERVAGSTLSWMIAERAAAEGRSIYLLGGDPGAADGSKRVLEARYPGLKICGLSSPRVSNPATLAEIETLVAELEPHRPDIVYVAFGSPKQEYVARDLRDRFPHTWFIGVGISLGFISGQVERAPEWMQELGLEWVHRLVQEPKKLAHRYLVDDLPFAALLFAKAAKNRIVRR